MLPKKTACCPISITSCPISPRFWAKCSRKCPTCHRYWLEYSRNGQLLLDIGQLAIDIGQLVIDIGQHAVFSTHLWAILANMAGVF